MLMWKWTDVDVGGKEEAANTFFKYRLIGNSGFK
jgi:hypothetical protein